MSHPFQCRCGALAGELTHTASARRTICYCKDCQDYAKRIGLAKKLLDANGGTETVGTQARHVNFTRGKEHLACTSLSEGGLLRWYAKCCNTPIANTPRDWRFSYAGIYHCCLKKPLEDTFACVDMHVNNQSAIGTPPKPRRGQFFSLLGLYVPVYACKAHP